MEQIEKALERARQMRSGGAAGPSADRPAIPQVSPFPETAHLTALSPALDRCLIASTGHPASEMYRVLRTQVLQRMNANGTGSLAVTAASPRSGGTTTAANLAISMALDVNQTVLLVDLNLRTPDLARKFGLEPDLGIEDYLTDGCALKDCLISSGMARLVILPARLSHANAAEIITSPRMAALARELRARYGDRKIIYDTPPLLDSGDTLGFLPHVDAVLFVARKGINTKGELKRAAELLANHHVIGTLLND